MKSNSLSTKVAIASKPATKAKSQPVVGKLNGGMQAMPGSKGKGQSVKTAPSNPIAGAGKSSGTAMGSTSGGVLPGFV